MGRKNTFWNRLFGSNSMVYRINGYKIPRDASQQSEFGENIKFY